MVILLTPSLPNKLYTCITLNTVISTTTKRSTRLASFLASNFWIIVLTNLDFCLFIFKLMFMIKWELKQKQAIFYRIIVSLDFRRTIMSKICIWSSIIKKFWNIPISMTFLHDLQRRYIIRVKKKSLSPHRCLYT